MYRYHAEAKQLKEQHLPYPQPWEFVYESFFKNTRNGFFVDVGASDGICCSNTSLLEFHLGWNGVCIEPNITQYEQLIKNRGCNTYNICIGDEDSTKEFWEIHGDSYALSGLYEAYDSRHIERIKKEGDLVISKEIEVKKLSTLMNELNINHIDYLSIDVEGAELQVLKGIDFGKCLIDVMSIEDNGYSNANSIIELLATHKFDYITKVCADMIFKKRL